MGRYAEENYSCLLTFLMAEESSIRNSSFWGILSGVVCHVCDPWSKEKIGAYHDILLWLRDMVLSWDKECDLAGCWVMMMCHRRSMESRPMGMRLSRSHEGFLSLNIRTGLSSWIHHWTQHSYTQNNQLLSSYHVFHSISNYLPWWFRHLWWFDSPIWHVQEAWGLLGSIWGRLKGVGTSSLFNQTFLD